MSFPQIPLDLAPEPDFALERFEVGACNRAAFQHVTAWPNWPAPVLLLIGPEGVGKTHLSTAWARKHAGLFLEGQQVQANSHTSHQGVICIDGAEKADEQALFTILNSALNGQAKGVLLTARTVPQTWDIIIPDLRSRMVNTPHVALGEHDDEILEPIVRKLFEDRGRDVSADVVQYLLHHDDRSVANLRRRVAELDFAARQTKKDMTKRFVSTFLKSQ